MWFKVKLAKSPVRPAVSDEVSCTCSVYANTSMEPFTCKLTAHKLIAVK